MRGFADPARLYALLAPLLYLAYALVTPVFQTPDEQQHLYRAAQLASFQLLAERRGDELGGELPPGLQEAAEKELGANGLHLTREVPQVGWIERWARATDPGFGEAPRYTNFLGSAAYSPAGYVPQVIAIWTGRLAGLSVEHIVRLGRVLNAALAFGLLAMAFRALPLGRLLLLVVALMPMSVACAASFGQDGLILGGSAWLTAIGIRAIMSRGWGKGDGTTAILLASAVTLAKFVYLPLAAMALFVRERGSRLWLSRSALLAVLVAAVLMAAWMALNSARVVPMIPGRPAPAEQLAFLMQHPGALLSAMATTWNREALLQLSLLVTFGWMNVGPVLPALGLSFGALLVALWQGDQGAARLSLAARGWIALICAGTGTLICLALYLAATPLGDTRIHGLQARYFIPLFLPLFLCLLRERRGAEPHFVWTAAGLMVLANLVSLQAIAAAYYG